MSGEFISLSFRGLIQLEIIFQRKKELSVGEIHRLCSAKGKVSTGHFFSELQKLFGSHEEV